MLHFGICESAISIKGGRRDVQILPDAEFQDFKAILVELTVVGFEKMDS